MLVYPGNNPSGLLARTTSPCREGDELLSNADGLYSFLYRQQTLLVDESSWEGGRKTCSA